MQFISCHSGKLQVLAERRLEDRKNRFEVGLEAMDQLLPGGFARGAVHEFLMPVGLGLPRFVGLLVAKRAAEEDNADFDGGTGIPACVGGCTHHPKNSRGGVPPRDTDKNVCATEGKGRAIVWCDREHDVYPPAIAAAGIDLRKVYLLHPNNDGDEHWASVECLRCKGVGAMIAAPKRLSHVEARRLQLAAEAGGGVGILLRSNDRYASIYAAASRWLIEPAPGERTVQRWKMQLLSGHGGRTGKAIYLECDRETNHVRATEQLADRSVAAPAASAFG